MTPSKTLTSAAVAASIVGAVGFAVAQTTTEPAAVPSTTTSEPMPSTSAAPAPESGNTTVPSQDSSTAPELREPKADRN